MEQNGNDPVRLGKGFHIAHLNVRSLMGGQKLEMLKNQIGESDVDFFTLSETWLTDAIPDGIINLPSYTLCRADRSWNGANNGDAPKRGGGLLCYVKKGLKFSDTNYAHLNISCSDLEMQWVEINLEHVRPIVVVNVYRPPQGDYKKCCELIVEAFERSVFKDNTEFYFLGDFNINVKDTGTPAFKELNFTMRALGMRQHIDEPTRVAFRQGIKSSSTLDLIFTNSDIIKSSGTLDYNLSDHMAVFITRKKKQTKHEKIEFKGRSYKNYVREDFQQNLVDHDWRDFYNMTDPNNMWQYIHLTILGYINPTCPIKSFKVSSLGEPWITNEAIEAIKDKDRLLKKAKRTGLEEDWKVARTARNRVGRELELLRADFLKNQQVEHKSDPKKFWNTIASVIPNKKASTGIISIREEGTGEDVDPENTADIMNNFFTSVGPDLARKHILQWTYYGDEVDASIGNITTDVDELVKLFKGIETFKSSGFDDLSSRLCKDAFLVLTDQMRFLFNCSFDTGLFPEAWKEAKVVPLFKGGNRQAKGNYRPVSLLPLPGKLIEKIVHNRVAKFFEENQFLDKNQGGFRKGFSTVSTVADLTDDLFRDMNEGKTTLAAFIDLQKAFDTVDTNILLRKLQAAGIRSKTYNWCKSYLSKRSQRTIANGKVSKSRKIKCGVPQGSVLGPLLFLVYINDLRGALKNCKVRLYADDTVLYRAGDNVHEAAASLQASLNEFCLWSEANKLSVNVKKSKLMVFGSRSRVKKAKNLKIYMKGNLLQKVPTFKYLGVILDPTLTYNHHISSIVRTVLHKMTLMAKVKKYLNNDVALQIYKSMILPYFDYADVIFHKSNKSAVDKLQRLQNRCLRICMGANRRLGTDRIHKTLSIPFLEDRRGAHVLNFMFNRKAKKELLNVREIRTRAHDAPLFLVQIPRCESFKRSVGYFGSVEWNALPPNIRNIDPYLAFKYYNKKVMLRPLELIELNDD